MVTRQEASQVQEPCSLNADPENSSPIIGLTLRKKRERKEKQKLGKRVAMTVMIRA